MVKIRGKLLLISLFTFILILSSAYSAGSKLIITDVDVKVGSRTSNNLRDGDRVDDEAEPGDTIELRIEVKNNFTSSEDLDIEDISVEATIEDFDDGDESSEESSDFDLTQGRDKRVTLKFEVPEDIEEDTYDIEIDVEGDDENGTSHLASMTLSIDVEKENHLLRITRASLNPTAVSCNRRNVQLSMTVANLGAEDEDDVSIRILNNDLGVNINEDVGELTEDFEDDDNKFSNTYTFSVPADTQAGAYPVLVRALYDNDRRKAESSVTLTVNDCQSRPTGSTTSQTPNQSTGGVQVITPAPTQNPPRPQEEELPEGTIITRESPINSNAFIIGIIAAEVVAVIVGIVLLVALLKKK